MQNNRLLLEKYEQVQVNKILQDSFQHDFAAFEQYLIREGLWDTIKQKGANLVGGAKNALLQPLVKTVLDKIAQSDPEGFKQLQAAAQDPQKLQALLNSPEVQQQQQAISQDVAATAESVDEKLYDLYFNEAYKQLMLEAEQQGPGAFLNPGQHGSTAAYAAAQGKKVARRIPQQTLGQKIAGTADKAAIAGLKGLGKAGSAVSGLVGKGAQAIGQSKVGQAAGGFIGKATNWIKQHPKISLAAGLALLAATGGAAAVGAGGIAPLITSTLSAGAAGAAKGGVAGAAFGGIKNLAQQAQDAKSLKDINWKQAGKEALKKGAVGAAVGGAVGAGANVLGKAAAGVGKMVGGDAAAGEDWGIQDPRYYDAIKGAGARGRAKEIVDSLMNDKYGNLVNPYDVKFSKGYNLYDVFDAAKMDWAHGAKVEPDEVMQWAKTIAQQQSPEAAAKFLTKYIIQGTKNLGIMPLAPQ